MEWKLELNLKTKTILTRGSEFLMAWISWSRTWATRRTTTTSRKPLRWSMKNLHWRRMYLLLRADQRPKHDHATNFCLLIYKNWTYLWKILDWYWARNLFVYRSPVSKQLSTLLRHGDLPREEYGAVEFWWLKDYLRNECKNLRYWSDEMWKSRMYWSVRTRNSLSPSSSRSFRTQSHWSFITGQCINSELFLRVH